MEGTIVITIIDEKLSVISKDLSQTEVIKVLTDTLDIKVKEMMKEKNSK